MQNYLSVLNFHYNTRQVLVHLLFEELVDPTRYDKFKDYSKIKTHQLFGLLRSMGEYYNAKYYNNDIVS